MSRLTGKSGSVGEPWTQDRNAAAVGMAIVRNQSPTFQNLDRLPHLRCVRERTSDDSIAHVELIALRARRTESPCIPLVVAAQPRILIIHGLSVVARTLLRVVTIGVRARVAGTIRISVAA
jgi:hypothetical protein